MVKEIKPEANINKDWWIQYQKEIMKTNIYYAFVAVCEDVIVGFITGIVYPDPIDGCLVGLGQEFYIVPEFRKSGISEILYKELLASGKAHGAKFEEMISFEGQLKAWQGKGYNVHKYHLRRAV